MALPRLPAVETIFFILTIIFIIIFNFMTISIVPTISADLFRVGFQGKAELP